LEKKNMYAICRRPFMTARTTWAHLCSWTLSAAILLAAGTAVLAADAAALRHVISLDGIWQVEQGKMASAPTEFSHTLVVPGLVDMARPAFAAVGIRSKLREAFWYRRTFRVDGPLPAVAVLKVHKAMFGFRVILNGTPLGDHLGSFTPGRFDARAALRPGENEVLIRVGAFRTSVPKSVPSGWDIEKSLYIPGIFDSVELILSGAPHIERVQAVPDIEKKSVAVHAWLRHVGTPSATKLHFIVRERSTGQVAGEGDCDIPVAGDGAERQGQATIRLRHCRLWSPEDPFLYDLEVRGEADVLKTRFGMRSFRCDPHTGWAMLNGRPYFMRGSNVTLYRFFEDSERGDKPWRGEWVRRLHKAFHDMHWNCLRYCIGFPPESWYRIADEEGFLIQDEFPIWNGWHKSGLYDVDELVREYTEWIEDRWNHPCVAVWDACNESILAETGKAIRAVRGLDLSGRPWDNAWNTPQEPGDTFESHPYAFFYFKPSRHLSMFSTLNPAPGQPGSMSGSAQMNKGKNPVIVNEYNSMFLNRDGTPTPGAKKEYEALLGPDSTVQQRRELCARLLAAQTEFWRCHRKCAAVMQFCALGYSRPDGVTSDNWTDVEKLTWDPWFYQYARDAFAPVGLMIDVWAKSYPPGPGRVFPVVVINDLYETWKGTVRFRLLRDDKTIAEQRQACEVSALGSRKLTFALDIPAKLGSYTVEAALLSPGAPPVRSLRDFDVLADR
jgi:hypothetical protein